MLKWNKPKTNFSTDPVKTIFSLIKFKNILKNLSAWNKVTQKTVAQSVFILDVFDLFGSKID